MKLENSCLLSRVRARQRNMEKMDRTKDESFTSANPHFLSNMKFEFIGYKPKVTKALEDIVKEMGGNSNADQHLLELDREKKVREQINISPDEGEPICLFEEQSADRKKHFKQFFENAIKSIKKKKEEGDTAAQQTETYILTDDYNFFSTNQNITCYSIKYLSDSITAGEPLDIKVYRLEVTENRRYFMECTCEAIKIVLKAKYCDIDNFDRIKCALCMENDLLLSEKFVLKVKKQKQAAIMNYFEKRSRDSTKLNKSSKESTGPQRKARKIGEASKASSAISTTAIEVITISDSDDDGGVVISD